MFPWQPFLAFKVALWNRAGHYIFALLFLSSFFLSSPDVSVRGLDAYHTSTHGVALTRQLVMEGV